MPRIVHSVLSMRAATLDLTTRPAPYQVLVAWCCSRGAFHAAATALMGHLSRLQQARGELQEQHETLGTQAVVSMTVWSSVDTGCCFCSADLMPAHVFYKS